MTSSFEWKVVPSKAVHVELVAFFFIYIVLLNGFLQVHSREGCSIIYCDHSFNFVGASNLPSSLDWTFLVSDTVLHPIKWKFNPPTGSWWDGWWERLIDIKKILRRVFRRTSVTHEQMRTILCDCESMINSRPIICISDNDAELVL